MKHLVRLYPKRWRERYGAEIGGFFERQRLSAAGIVDVLHGALDAHLHPDLGRGLVFVPTIGFRPSGTRALLERAEATTDDTHLSVLAVAATPERTEVIVEWERTKLPEACAPPPPSSLAPADVELTAALVARAATFEATSMARQAYDTTGWAIRSMVFPPLPRGTRDVELRVNHGERLWRVPLRLVASRVEAMPIAIAAERNGITIRATARTWHDDELIVAMEATASRSIGRIGMPAPAMPIPPSGRKFKVMRGVGFEPITLEDDRGVRVEEIRRLYHPLRDRPEPHVDGEPFVQTFNVFFAAPQSDARTAVIAVPFVELTDVEGSVIVDLRDVPLEVAIGEHRFRVLRSDAYPASTARRMHLEIPPSTGSPRFMHPAGVHGTPPGGYSWSGEPQRGEPFLMETTVGDPPIVRFRGAVLRYEGPWRLEIPLA